MLRYMGFQGIRNRRQLVRGLILPNRDSSIGSLHAGHSYYLTGHNFRKFVKIICYCFHALQYVVRDGFDGVPWRRRLRIMLC